VSELRIPIHRLQPHEDLQLRVEVSPDLVSRYADALSGDLPPIDVFDDGDTLWLADGYHRYQAAQRRGDFEISAKVRPGSFDDAFLFAIQANRKHGLQRNSGDIRKAFETGVRREVFDPTDSRTVQSVIGCSQSKAYQLTQPYRDRAKQRRNDDILSAKSDGKSDRQIANDFGVNRRNVAQVAQNSTVEKCTTPPEEGSSEPNLKSVQYSNPDPLTNQVVARENIASQVGYLLSEVRALAIGLETCTATDANLQLLASARSALEGVVRG